LQINSLDIQQKELYIKKIIKFISGTGSFLTLLKDY